MAGGAGWGWSGTVRCRGVAGLLDGLDDVDTAIAGEVLARLARPAAGEQP